MQPDISVVIPAYNEGPRLAHTVESIASNRSTTARVEVVIVDDASTDNTERYLKAAWTRLSQLARLDVHLCTLDTRGGVPRTRNHGAGLATADVLVTTDAHVTFSSGWDATVLREMRPDPNTGRSGRRHKHTVRWLWLQAHSPIHGHELE